MSIEDTRKPAYGVGRVLIAVYAIFAVSALARATVQLIRDADQAPLAYSLSAVAALFYVVATVALAHNGRRMRMVAWGSASFELVGVIVVGAVSLMHPELFPRATVWSQFGSGYGYIPLVLPFLGLWWLWFSSPKRIIKQSS